jgi:hypothetical protein
MGHIIRFPLDQQDCDEGGIPLELAELGRLIEKVSCNQQAELQEAYCRAVDAARRRRHILDLVQEALSQLRLDIKYLLFDLEWTRRERSALQQQLDDQI